MISIYQIIKRDDGKMYIGQTAKTISERWQKHLTDAKRRRHMLVSRAIYCHGADAFEIRKIDEASTQERADAFERFYIGLFDTLSRERGYNVALGGMSCANFSGRKHSAESKIKISISGRKNPARHWLGKKFSKEQRDKMSKSSAMFRKDIPDKEIVRMYEQGFDCPRIAELFNTNKTTIGWRLKRFGIKMRSTRCNLKQFKHEVTT